MKIEKYDPQEVAPLVAEWKRTRSQRVFRRLSQIFEIAVTKYTYRWRTHPDYDDIVQVARMAVWSALDKFDPKRGLQFSTLLNQLIHFAIGRHLRDNNGLIRIPAYLYERGERPMELLRLVSSSNKTGGKHQEDEFIDVPVDADFDEELERAERVSRVRCAIEKLPPRERHVIHEVFYNERSCADIGPNDLQVGSSMASHLKRCGLALLERDLQDLAA